MPLHQRTAAPAAPQRRPGPAAARASAPASAAVRRPRCACGGGCPGCNAGGVSALRLDTPGDRWERDADRVARALMAGQPARPLAAPAGPVAQRIAANASPEREDAQVVEDDEDEATPVQRLASGSGAVAGPSWTARLGSAGSGQALPAPLARRFGQGLGTDLGGVRVHADGTAAALCDGIAARAFTRGDDIFFNRGEYRPAEHGGQQVLAHELAHVLQQRGAAPRVQRLSALEQTSRDNLLATNVQPWAPVGPRGNDYRVQTDGGNDINAWVPYGGAPESERYWCHGFSLGSYAAWGYSVWSGAPMGRVITDEFNPVADAQAQAGDLAVWLQMPDGGQYGHSAVITRPVLDGGVLDDAHTELDSKNGRRPLAHTTLAALKAEPGYGIDVGIFRKA